MPESSKKTKRGRKPARGIAVIPQLPTVAIVGRPNVGKSTLFNRLVGWRRAIVGDEPGITRDRLYGECNWNGRRIRVVDTGGVIPEDEDLMLSEIYRQAQVAMEEAGAIIMVVDGRTELASPDMELARLLLRSGRPLFLAVNKIDSPAMIAAAENFRRLGITRLYSISAEHSSGVAELLEAVLEVLPQSPVEAETAPDSDTWNRYQNPNQPVPDANSPSDIALVEARLDDIKIEEVPADQADAVEETADGKIHHGSKGPPAEVRVAIIGRPNVGKSTLLNRLTGTERSIVSAVAGTTRDAVDEVVSRDGKHYRFIDTAGIRRKGKTKLMAEKLSVVMARKHLEAADIAVLMIDATAGVMALDATIGGYAHESGRSVIIVVNKWDLVGVGGQSGKGAADQQAYEERLRYNLKFLNYAPVVFISATVGKSAEKLFAVLEHVAAGRWKRITTGEMNRFLKHVDFERASVPSAKRVRIYYLTQAHVAPPTFILFTDRAVKLHFSYQRFLENQIRKAFGFEGSPIWIKSRAHSK